MAETQEMIQEWLKAQAPGEPHRFLDRFVGEWDTSSLMWWAGPTEPATESNGTAEIKWILDGRFLLEEQNSEMMGKPQRGMGLTGYDNFRKKYISTYLDNLQTSIYKSEGTLDRSGKVITYHGKMDEPTTGELDKLFKCVVRIIDKDKHVFEVYDLVGTPEEFKAVETTYSRKC